MKCVQTVCISIYLLMSSSKFLTDELFKEFWKKIQLKVNSLSSLQQQKRDFFTMTFAQRKPGNQKVKLCISSHDYSLRAFFFNTL